MTCNFICICNRRCDITLRDVAVQANRLLDVVQNAKDTLYNKWTRNFVNEVNLALALLQQFLLMLQPTGRTEKDESTTQQRSARTAW